MNFLKTIFAGKNLKHALVLIFFIFCAIYITWPLAFNLSTTTTGFGDELYVTWILNWNIHALTTDISQLFHGNIYFPYPYTISFSDPQLASSILALLPILLFQEPMLAFNINLILSFALLGFCTYLLVYFLTKDMASSIVSGTIFGFSTYLIPKIGQLQVISIYWIPLTLLFFFAYLRFKKFIYFLLMAICFYMQFINSFMPAYFLLFALFLLTFYEIKKDKKFAKLFINKKVILAIIFVFLISLPIIYPYYQTSSTFGYTRDIREAIHTANRPELFFYSYGNSHIGPFISSIIYQSPIKFTYDGYRGFVNILLTFAVLGFLFFAKKKPKYFSIFSLIAIGAYILSLGPAFQLFGQVIKYPFIIPLPYALLYYIAPGFQGFRNSGRWEVFEIFAFSIAIGILLAYLLKRWEGKKYIIAFVLCILVLAEYSFSIKLYPIEKSSNIPHVYRAINKLPKNSVIAEFPIYNWDMYPYSENENKRLYYSTFHFRKTLNGTGGFSPYAWQGEIKSLASQFPKSNAINLLKKKGIEYIIVHEDEFNKMAKDGYKINGYEIPDANTVKSELKSYTDIELIYSINEDNIYKLL